MSYEIITRFSINRKNNSFSITAHPNNIVPASNYSFTETMSHDNMRSLFENLLYGNWHPTNSINQLHYAMARSEYETKQKYNMSSDVDISWYLYKHAIWINDERIYNPIEDHFFSLFIKYLFEKDSPGKYLVSDGYYMYRPGKTNSTYYTSYLGGYIDSKFTMSFKAAYSFIYRYAYIKGLRPVQC